MGRASSPFTNPSLPSCVPGPILAGAEKPIPAPHQEPWQTKSRGSMGPRRRRAHYKTVMSHILQEFEVIWGTYARCLVKQKVTAHECDALFPRLGAEITDVHRLAVL